MEKAMLMIYDAAHTDNNRNAAASKIFCPFYANMA